ncbi:thioredoxin domain-containing protein [Candidatus Aquiluna sp. UB-MaderosW2red]|uniref:DsbA family protein n=1 Tax=Candidatus Aquiluna sp. UB-MaderosW2red TaxID=1855377 RepID=UPI000875D66E|nr:thioredoxin domain-containing protein [Candidatus Aquiluna sp. UB-MaderosW2red]SCX14965.1 Thioredoxin [Candidatus Aquiluna sp. UB-MaderosW2red]
MKISTKIAIGLSGALVLIVVVVMGVISLQAQPSSTAGEGNPETGLASAIREDTHILDDAGEGAVTLVEFLDFECEACAAFYPVIADLRKEFAGEVTFALRYFPLPGHFNSKNAALAVEAAAQQGQLEGMYTMMFQTQLEWGEAQETRAPLFRQFAEDLNLNLAEYDATVANPATLARIESDFDDGLELGVASTPTFFLNNRMLQLTSFDDLRLAIVQELGR